MINILISIILDVSAVFLMIAARYQVQGSKSNLRMAQMLSDALEELRTLRMDAAMKRGEVEGKAWGQALLSEITEPPWNDCQCPNCAARSS